MAILTATANKLIDKLLRNVDFTPASALYLALHTADPGGTGANEVTGGAGPYARQAVSFNAAANKHADAVSALNFAGMPACTVTHVSLWSAASGGTEWLEGTLAVQKSVNAGDTFQLAASDIDFDLT